MRIGFCTRHPRNDLALTRAAEDGCYQVAQKGSHVQFKYGMKPGRVTVPHPKKDLPTGTLRSIEKQAGIKLK